MEEERLHSSLRFATWDVYPKASYLKKRFQDFNLRFTRVMATVPETLQEKTVMDSLKNLNEEVRKQIVVNVFGDNLEQEDVVLNAGLLPESSKEDPGITIDVIVLRHNGVDETDLMENISSLLRGFEGQGQELVVFCKTSLPMFDLTKQKAYFSVTGNMPDKIKQRLKYHNFMIVNEDQGDSLKTMLPEVLERRVANGFLSIQRELLRYIRTDVTSKHEKKETSLMDNCEPAVKSFLRDVSLITDFMARSELDNESRDSDTHISHSDKYMESERSLTGETKMSEITVEEKQNFGTSRGATQKLSNSSTVPKLSGKNMSDDSITKVALNALVSTIRCASVNYLAAKYQIPQWVCNSILIEMGFEKMFAECMSKNTCYGLRKMVENLQEVGSSTRKFGYIFYMIKQDFESSNNMTIIGKELSKMKRISNVMNKMTFEVNGYLKQTVFQDEDYFQDITEKQSEKEGRMRLELLKLPGTYGLGTVYGQLEVHIDTTKAEDIEKLKEDIHGTIKRHHFDRAYEIKEVCQKAKKLAHHDYEQGDELLSPFPDAMTTMRRGTLGCFVKGKDNQKYGITCAHVVDPHGQKVHFVSIKKRGQRVQPLGTSSANRTLSTNESDVPCIDIAAIQVSKNREKQCNIIFKNEEEQHRPGQLAMEPPPVGTLVYKFGAKTGLTKGIVSVSDYQLQEKENKTSHAVLIESCPGNIEDIEYITGEQHKSIPPQTEQNHEVNTDSGIGISLQDVLPTSNNIGFEESPSLAEAQEALQAENLEPISCAAGINLSMNEVCIPCNDLEHPRPEITDDGITRNSELGAISLKAEQSYNFAEEGDSGSIVCTKDIKTDTIIVISMVVAGDFQTQTCGEAHPDAKKCISFLLRTGLQKLGLKFKEDPEFFQFAEEDLQET